MFQINAYSLEAHILSMALKFAEPEEPVKKAVYLDKLEQLCFRYRQQHNLVDAIQNMQSGGDPDGCRIIFRENEDTKEESTVILIPFSEKNGLRRLKKASHEL